jgi:NAD-dependent deacetylase
VITQNVDGLRQEAGSKNVLELHGDLRSLKCNWCQYTTDDQEYWKHTWVPKCPQCQCDMRPNIVWFGEMLPVDTLMLAKNAAMNSHSMIVVGTSGQVYPAAELPAKVVDANGHVYECNPELAFTMLNMVSHLYHPMQGKATVTVPIAVQQLLKRLEKL